ncbi:MAG: LptF/LptG family permease [Verrucomicrobia subdivision 3 bacterium]|nr:LptF/LptG family permease [Limisphaerales bacterium]
MRTLQLYLLRQVIVTLVMTLLVFTFVLLLGDVLKEILGLLVNRQASLGVVAKSIGLLIPFIWVFALPMAMLTSTLLVFGRFSADQELTAARASGISLVSLIAPILGLSLALCGLSAMVNLEWGPRSRMAYKDILFRFTAEITTSRLLPEGRHIRDIPGYVFFIGKNRDGQLEDVMIYKLASGTNDVATIHAARGKLEINPTNQTYVMHLYDANGIRFNGDRASPISGEDLTESFSVGQRKGSDVIPISDMTFTQLRAELSELETKLRRTAAGNGQLPAANALLESEVRRVTSPVHVQMHRRLAYSFACFSFTLLGIPLGIRVQRRETNIGFAIALVLVLIYYGVTMLGLSLDRHPEWMPHLILWIPNLICQTLGAWLLWRANRGL